MSQKSIINNQDAIISQLIPPSGVGLRDNTDASLVAYVGSLATDEEDPGSLFIGNGAAWVNVSNGNSIDLAITNFTLTGSNSQPNLTATMYIQQITFQLTTVNYFTLVISNSINVTVGTSDWSNTSAIIGEPFTPNGTYIYPFPTNFGSANAYLYLSPGEILIQLTTPGATGTTSFYNCTGSYISS